VAAPLLAKVSLSFQSPDYVVLMFLGLTAIAAFSNKGQFLKAIYYNNTWVKSIDSIKK